MMNQTMENFGYPKTLIKEYDYWCVLLRPQQVTLGSLVLICKENVTSFSEISSDAFREYPQVIIEIENGLKNRFKFDKINYLMLMMVDPNVHFHVIPRYSEERQFEGFVFTDYSWPAAPLLDKINNIDEEIFMKLLLRTQNSFNQIS